MEARTVMRTMRIYFSVLLGLLFPLLIACGNDKEENMQEIGPHDNEVNNRFYMGTELVGIKENREKIYLELTGENINHSGIPVGVWFRDDYLYLTYPSPGDSLYTYWNGYLENTENKVSPIFIRRKVSIIYEKIWGDTLTTPDKSLGAERMGGFLVVSPDGMADEQLIMEARYPKADSLGFWCYAMVYDIQTLPKEGKYHVFDTEAEADAFIRESLGMGN